MDRTKMSDVMFPGRFRDLANFYTTGRPTYPRLLARRVADLIGLDGSQTVLDLGTGPGFLAIDFHPFAGKVIGVDGAGDPARDRTHGNKDHETVLLDSAFSHLERLAVAAIEARLQRWRLA